MRVIPAQVHGPPRPGSCPRSCCASTRKARHSDRDAAQARAGERGRPLVSGGFAAVLRVERMPMRHLCHGGLRVVGRVLLSAPRRTRRGALPEPRRGSDAGGLARAGGRHGCSGEREDAAGGPMRRTSSSTATPHPSHCSPVRAALSEAARPPFRRASLAGAGGSRATASGKHGPVARAGAPGGRVRGAPSRSR